ncbi:MAG TPA: hypothetical protein VKA61_02940, partial [Sphingomicrobium sp.]|nr:hypothetical protein [Sphingomicrobium sp.]
MPQRALEAAHAGTSMIWIGSNRSRSPRLDRESSLAHMVVGTSREAPHPIRLTDPAGQHDHGQVGIDSGGKPIRGTHAVEQVESATRLEREVQQHEARPP